MKIRVYINIIAMVAMMTACGELDNNAVEIDSVPSIFPDYVGVTVPRNIAPMNFTLVSGEETVRKVNIENCKGGKMIIKGAADDIPSGRWRKLLDGSAGDSLRVTVFVDKDGTLYRYKPFTIYVSENEIDKMLVYRKIAPSYEVYSKMGIYQRNLETFDEDAIVENTLVKGMCVNCHAFNQSDPYYLTMHFRGDNGATLVKEGQYGKLLNTATDKTIASAVYPYWHPSGKYIAYSTNNTKQGFHVGKRKRVEVIDLASDLMVYDVENDVMLQSDLLKGDESFETYPVFSPDGDKLYFCSAKARVVPDEYDEIRYDLCCIDFDAERGTFGSRIDTLVKASEIGRSVAFPRPSYDGKYIMYTLSNYGNFPIWHDEANLWLLDLSTGKTRALDEVNSNETDSFHNWSGDSKWFVFSSRRGDGLYTRLYLASMDSDGNVSKPFLLPQRHPREHDLDNIYSYNVPAFADKEINIDPRKLRIGLTSKERVKVKAR